MMPSPSESWRFVHDYQSKLRAWSVREPTRAFDDIGNFIADPRTLRAAYCKVSQAPSAKIPDADGTTCASLERSTGVDWCIKRLSDDLKGRRFMPGACRRCVARRKGKDRPTAIFVVRDRIVHHALCLVLTPIIEARLHRGASSYIRGRTQRYALEYLGELARNPSIGSFVEIDIAGYFDSIDHGRLIAELRSHVCDGRVLSLVEKIISSGMTGQMWSCSTGIVAGSPLSNVLANLYRNPLDRFLEHRTETIGVVGYGDDVRVAVAGDAHVARKVLDDAASFAKHELRLAFSSTKSRIVGAGEEVVFLSQAMEWGSGIVRFRPSDAAVDDFKTKAREDLARNTKEVNKVDMNKASTLLSGFINYAAQVSNRHHVESLAQEALAEVLGDR